GGLVCGGWCLQHSVENRCDAEVAKVHGAQTTMAAGAAPSARTPVLAAALLSTCSSPWLDRRGDVAAVGANAPDYPVATSSAGAGSAPNCCSKPSVSKTSCSSTSLPSAQRLMMMPTTVACLPVGATPISSPRCVPVAVQRATPGRPRPPGRGWSCGGPGTHSR